MSRREFDLLIFYKDIYGNTWMTKKLNIETQPCDTDCWKKTLARYAKGQ